MIFDQGEISAPGYNLKFFACRDRCDYLSGGAWACAQTDIFIAISIEPGSCDRFEYLLNGVGLGIGEMPPFTGIRLEAIFGLLFLSDKERWQVNVENGVIFLHFQFVECIII